MDKNKERECIHLNIYWVVTDNITERERRYTSPQVYFGDGIY